MVFAHGPVDYVTEISFDEKQAWYGLNRGGIITINKPNLFGGDKREGGVSGLIDFEQGKSVQYPNNYMVNYFGGVGNVPGHKGVIGFVLNQFYLGLSPYIKKCAAVFSRVYTTKEDLVQWYPAKAGIPNLNTAVTTAPGFADQVPGISTIFSEAFEGDFALFVAESGTKTMYSIIDRFYGFRKYLRVNFISTTATVNRIAKTIPAITPEGVSFRFVVNNRGGDDNLIFELRDSSNATVFKFRPCVDNTSDAIRRGRIKVGSGSEVVVGRFANTDAFETATEFLCRVQKTGSSTWICKVFRTDVYDSDPSADIGLYTTVTGTGSFSEVTKIVFYNKSTIGTGSGQTEYDEVNFLANQYFRPDMNPAHIIRECLTDSKWGMGYSDADIDDASFITAANTLFDEQMGISMIWDTQVPIEDFILEITKHIDGVVFVNRSTGLFTLKLLRNDYVVGSLLTLNESNIVSIQDYTKRLGDDLVNSVSVKYTNGYTWKDALVEVQDLGAIIMQGATVNTTVDYPGFCNPIVATKAARRDLKTLSSPLIGCTIIANSDAYDLNIGSAFKLTWPDYDITDKIMRVVGLSISDGTNTQVRINCTEDSFAATTGNFVVVEDSAWTTISVLPTPSTYVLPYEIPYYELVQAQGQSDVDAVLVTNPLASYVGAAAVEVNGSINALLYIDAGSGYEESATLDYSPYGVTLSAVGFSTTTISLDMTNSLADVEDGTHAQINNELLLIVSCDELFNTITVARGCLDTVPTTHPAGSKVIFWDSQSIADTVEYNESETIAVKVCPVTGLGALDPITISGIDITLRARAIRPYPPGNVQIAGSYYPITVLTQPFNVTWAHRDRLQQTSTVLLDFLSASVGPEAGTSYTLKVYGIDMSLVATYSGLSGTSQSISGIAIPGDGFIELYSVRDGYDSYQKHLIPVKFSPASARLTEDGVYLLDESGLYFEEE